MKLIIGLGNPGKKYQPTWHNVGFTVLNQIQANWALEKFKQNKQLQADISSGTVSQQKIILAKPLTFMNHSGISVSATVNYYKINLSDIIIVHDDIDLPLGAMRLSQNSSAGGHNGVKSIIENLGSQDFTRLRVGIYTDTASTMDTPKYVLNKINKSENLILNQVTKQVAEALLNLINDVPIAQVMNRYN